MIDPTKLMALVKRENSVKPFHDEDMGDEGEEPMPGEEAEPEEPEAIELTPEEIEAIGEMVENGEGEPELMDLAEALQDEIDEMGEEAELPAPPPAWATSPAIWETAEKAVDPEGVGSTYTEPYAVVSHVYKKMGGSIA